MLINNLHLKVCYDVLLVSSGLHVADGLGNVNAAFAGSGEWNPTPRLYGVTLKCGLLCVLSNLACMQVLTWYDVVFARTCGLKRISDDDIPDTLRRLIDPLKFFTCWYPSWAVALLHLFRQGGHKHRKPWKSGIGLLREFSESGKLIEFSGKSGQPQGITN